eukprot:6489412-Amphidinium_carterae.3
MPACPNSSPREDHSAKDSDNETLHPSAQRNGRNSRGNSEQGGDKYKGIASGFASVLPWSEVSEVVSAVPMVNLLTRRIELTSASPSMTHAVQ